MLSIFQTAFTLKINVLRHAICLRQTFVGIFDKTTMYFSIIILLFYYCKFYSEYYNSRKTHFCTKFLKHLNEH